MNTIHLAIDEPIKSTLLEQFLHKSNIEKKISTFEEMIAKNLLKIETNDLPIASILAFEKLNPDKSFFFKASPCFFSLQRDFYRFEKNFDNQLDSNTLLDLCNLLNKNFSSDSINFIIKDKFILLKANSHTAVGSFFPEQLNSSHCTLFISFYSMSTHKIFPVTTVNNTSIPRQTELFATKL